MGTTAQKLQSILSSKVDIKNALSSKYGISVGDRLSDWGDTIRNFNTSITIPQTVGSYEYYFRYGSRTSSALVQTKQEYTDTITSVDMSALTSCASHGMNSTFLGCSNLTTLTLPARTTNLYANASSFEYTFRDCTSLSSPIVIPAYGISNYTYRGTFYNCSSIPSAEICMRYENSQLTAYNTWFVNMFSNCTSMTEFTFSGASTITGNSYLFNGTLSGCTALKRIYINGVKKITTTSGTTSTFGIIPSGLTTTTRKLDAIYCPDLEEASVCTSSNASYYSLFMQNTSSTNNRVYVNDIYFPKLSNIGQYAFNYIDGANIHFAAENKTAIESLPRYEYHFSNWGYNTTTFLFDL